MPNAYFHFFPSNAHSRLDGDPDYDWMTYDDGQKLAELRRQAGGDTTAFSIPEAGHMVMLDQPDRLVDVMLSEMTAKAGGPI